MNREECTEAVLTAKRAKGLTWQQIADAVGRHVVWTTAAPLGQATMDESEAVKAAEFPV
jgi:cyanate lyase